MLKADATADRQAIVLSLACLSLARPGWHAYLRDIAVNHFERGPMFDQFRTANADQGAAASIAAHGIIDKLEGQDVAVLAYIVGAALGEMRRRGADVDAVMEAADEATRKMAAGL